MLNNNSFSVDELLRDRYAVYAQHYPHAICKDTNEVWLFDPNMCKTALMSQQFTSQRSRLQALARESDCSDLAKFYDNWLMYSEGEKHKALKKLASSTVSETLSNYKFKSSFKFDFSSKKFDLISDFCEPWVLQELSSRLAISKIEFEYWLPRLKKLIDLPGSQNPLKNDFLEAETALIELREFIKDGYPKNCFYSLLKQTETSYPDQELIDLTINVLGDGIHPTIAGLGMCLHHLIKSKVLPIIDEDILDVERIMESPFQYVARHAISDISFGELRINKGDRVILCIGASCPSFIDKIDMIGSSENLTFGKGLHSCLGKRIALSTIATGIKTFQEITKMKIRANAQPTWINSVGYLSIESYPIIRDTF